MLDAKICLAKAEETERMAAGISDSSSQAALLKIAGTWRKMAADPAFNFSTEDEG